MILDQTRLENKYFEYITMIPHVSTNEKGISDYVVSIAKKLGYEYDQDDLYNVSVIVPASPGYQNHDDVLLSGHMDMVGTKTGDSSFDFDKDALNLYLEGNILKAKETTLGADDGVAVAYMLALMSEADSFDHPRLECVFTVQEEIGCNGSRFVDTSKLQAKKMIGLDTVGEHQITVGNYCSDRVDLVKDLNWVENHQTGYELTLTGFDAPVVTTKKLTYKDNAILYTAHWLKDQDVQIASIQSGKGENFPPQEMTLSLVIDENHLQQLLTSLDDFVKVEKKEISIDRYLTVTDSHQLLSMLGELPNGPLAAQKEEMLSSFLVGIACIKNGQIQVVGSTRCKNNEYNQSVLNQLKEISQKYDVMMSNSVRYRSWEYQEHSQIKEVYRQLVKERWHKDLEEVICPGGLEISDFLYKMPDLDVLSMGPLAGNFHVPGEWLDIPSFNRTYDLLKALLTRL